MKSHTRLFTACAATITGGLTLFAGPHAARANNFSLHDYFQDWISQHQDNNDHNNDHNNNNPSDGLWDLCGVYNFTANPDGDLHSSLTFSNDGVDVTATGSYTQNGGSPVAANVGHYSPGLGIKNSSGDSHTVDGAAKVETMWLTASEEIKWTHAAFGYVGLAAYGTPTNKVDVVDDSGSLLHEYDLDTDATSAYGYDVLDLTGLNYTGTKLGLRAPGSGDSWKVAGVARDCDYSPTTVPTPTAALAGLAMLGFQVVRRRRRESDIA